MPDERTLLVACIPRLRRYARALLGNRPDADDLVQDTVERALNKLALWRGGDMRPWLFGIMHNLYVDQVRHPAPPTQELDDMLPAETGDGSDAFETADLEAALRKLPAEQREVLLLSALEDMTYAEIAAALHIPPGTVMSRLARAREKLRAMMMHRPRGTHLKVVK